MTVPLQPLILLAALLGALALNSGCASNPATGGTDIVIMSQGREVAIGEEMHQEMMAQGAAYDDAALQAYIDRIGRRLVANSDRPELEFTFTVIDSPDINAFATPGGFVYINRGLLAYLDSEAELAGVLAHEIAHVTARHAARQQTANVTNQVLATAAGILTGSGDVADAAGMYGKELVSGYGREHELEADSLGAEYMHRSGYSPDALLEVIGVLKDQEQYQRVKARASGKKVASYHGLYATHPRNDARLQQVIQAAGELELEAYPENPEVPGEFRQRVDGLAWGTAGRARRADDRFYHNKLGFTFNQPPDWEVNVSAGAIVAAPKSGGESLTLTIRRQDRSRDAKALLSELAGAEPGDGRVLEQAGLTGYTGIDAAGGPRRLAAIDYNGLTYLFEGKTDAGDFGASDPRFLAIIESFRPMAKSEFKSGKPQFIQYVQVPRGTTFAKLASSVRIPDAEAQLRLINGYYPSGEPRTGDWIKVVRQAP
jgi:predicted Zn-dependent protease